ncbi:MAG: OmpA family protein [Candidatus Melainabacteria bacterium]|nr:OmpA family protein [Candidatus Melainabacteria bacterium]
MTPSSHPSHPSPWYTHPAARRRPLLKTHPLARQQAPSSPAFEIPKPHPTEQHIASSHSLWQRLNSLEEGVDGSHAPGSSLQTGANRWLIPYADILTLLLCLVMMLFALSNQHNLRLEEQNQALQKQIVQQQTDSALNMVAQAAESTPPAVDGDELSEALEESGLLQAETGVNLTKDERGTVLSLPEKLLFSPGEAQLSPGAAKTLDHIAQALKKLPHHIRVEGHTDHTPIATPRFPSNWELSTARATHILRYLAKQHGIAPQRLSAVGYGEFKPIANNSTIEGKQKNRRVDIVMVDPSGVTERHSRLSD